MTQERQDLLQALLERLMAVMKQVGRGISLSRPELTPPQMHLLLCIADRPEGITVGGLAEMNGVTPGAITQFVTTLVEKGLVERRGDTSDRRIVRLKLTDSASQHLESFRQEYFASAARVFQVLSEEEMRQLVEILGKLVASQSTRGQPAAG